MGLYFGDGRVPYIGGLILGILIGLHIGEAYIRGGLIYRGRINGTFQYIHIFRTYIRLYLIFYLPDYLETTFAAKENMFQAFTKVSDLFMTCRKNLILTNRPVYLLFNRVFLLFEVSWNANG